MNKQDHKFIFYNPNESKKAKQQFEKAVEDILIKAAVNKLNKDNDFKTQL